MDVEDGIVPNVVTNFGEFKTDEDHVATNLKLSIKFPPQRVSVFSEIIDVFIDPLETKHYERHALLIRRALKCYQCGFLIRELQCLVHIINECVRRLGEYPKFIEIISEIVRICRLPFLLQKTSDELRYRTSAVECIEHLGYLLKIDNDQLREQVCRSINQFYCVNDYKDTVICAENIKQTTKEFNKQIVDEGDICESISRLFLNLGSDDSLKCVTYELIMSLSNNSESNCNKMLWEGILPCLLKYLDEAVEKENGRMILMITQILWNMMEYGISANLSQQLANKQILNNFKDIFVKYMTQSFSSEDRQLRNDLLSIVCLMVSRCSNLPLTEIDLVKVIAVFATFMEVRSQNVLVKHLKLSPCEKEDFELKKMLFDALLLLLKVPGSLQIYSECRLIQALLRYLHCGPFHLSKSLGSNCDDETHQGTLDAPLVSSSILHPQSFWFQKQYEEIHKLALFTLSKVAPLMLNDVINCNVPKFLMEMFAICIQSSFPAVDGFCQVLEIDIPLFINKHLLKGCIAIIHNLVVTKNVEILKRFHEFDALKPFLDLLNHLAVENLSMDQCTIHIQSDLLTIISILCDGNEKEALNKEGVDILMKYLRMDTEAAALIAGKLNLLMSSIHCIWTCVVGHEDLEKHFLQKQGICLFLNILQKCPYNLKDLILGCLSDLLLVKESAAQQFISWFGVVEYENYLNSVVTIRDGITMTKKEEVCLSEVGPKLQQGCSRGYLSAPQLLCQLWRDEEARMGVLRNEMGIIVDLEAPLKSKEQQERTLIAQPATHSSASVVEIFGNLRSKIYFIFTQIGFVNLPGICARDQMTLTIIENYLDLKEAEVVKEMVQEMALEGIWPIAPDGESIHVMLRTIDAKHQRVKETQQEILDCMERIAISEEQIYYSKIREARNQGTWPQENYLGPLSQDNHSVDETNGENIANYSSNDFTQNIQTTIIEVKKTKQPRRK